MANHVWFCFVLILFSLVSHSSAYSCKYRVTVKTGDRSNAGTDARVLLRLCPDRFTCPVHVDDLAFYGTEGPHHDYFERAALEHFEIHTISECFNPCRMRVGHDNGGRFPGWYLDFVSIEAYDRDDVKQFQRQFVVNRWLARDEPPYNIEEEQNRCPVHKPDASALLRQFPEA